MNIDLTIYEVSVTYPTKLGQMNSLMTITEKVEGREHLDMVLAWLKERNLRASWNVFHAAGSGNVIKAIARKLSEFPVVELDNDSDKKYFRD
jgi:hypothetical protein